VLGAGYELQVHQGGKARNPVDPARCRHGDLGKPRPPILEAVEVFWRVVANFEPYLGRRKIPFWNDFFQVCFRAGRGVGHMPPNVPVPCPPRPGLVYPGQFRGTDAR